MIVYNEIINDSDWIQLQERLEPLGNIKLTIEKACIKFFGQQKPELETQKEIQSQKTLDWKQTLTNSLTMQSNKVYIQKQNGKAEKRNITREIRGMFQILKTLTK